MSDIIERLESFNERVTRILDNQGGSLTAGGQATAIAMLVTLNLNLFDECIAALKGSSVVLTGDGRLVRCE